MASFTPKWLILFSPTTKQLLLRWVSNGARHAPPSSASPSHRLVSVKTGHYCPIGVVVSVVALWAWCSSRTSHCHCVSLQHRRFPRFTLISTSSVWRLSSSPLRFQTTSGVSRQALQSPSCHLQQDNPVSVEASQSCPLAATLSPYRYQISLPLSMFSFLCRCCDITDDSRGCG